VLQDADNVASQIVSKHLFGFFDLFSVCFLM